MEYQYSIKNMTVLTENLKIIRFILWLDYEMSIIPQFRCVSISPRIWQNKKSGDIWVVVEETEVLDTIRKKINPIISRLWEICQEMDRSLLAKHIANIY